MTAVAAFGFPVFEMQSTCLASSMTLLCVAVGILICIGIVLLM